jgi:hypothetical protein
VGGEHIICREYKIGLSNKGFVCRTIKNIYRFCLLGLVSRCSGFDICDYLFYIFLL